MLDAVRDNATPKQARSISLRLRLLALAALTIAATLTVAGFSFSLIFEDHIERLIEQDLETRWRELAGAFVLDPAGRPEVAEVLTDPRYNLPRQRRLLARRGRQSNMVLALALVVGPGPGADRERSMSRRPARRSSSAGPTTPASMSWSAKSGSTAPRSRMSFGSRWRWTPSRRTACAQSFSRNVEVALGVIGLVLFGGAWLQASVGLLPLKRLARRIGESA